MSIYSIISATSRSSLFIPREVSLKLSPLLIFMLIFSRSLLESSSTAYISFLRSYKEHQCSYIFRFDRLNLGAVARCYALLKLPRIKELSRLQDRESTDFIPTNIDTSSIPYQHAGRESARQRKLERIEVEKREAGDGDFRSGDSSSVQKRQKGEIFEAKANLITEKRKRKKKQSYSQKREAEWDEFAAGFRDFTVYHSIYFYFLQLPIYSLFSCYTNEIHHYHVDMKEEALFKRFKKGHLTKEEYDEALLHYSVSEVGDCNSDSDDEIDGSPSRRQSLKTKAAVTTKIDYRNRKGKEKMKEKGRRKTMGESGGQMIKNGSKNKFRSKSKAR